MILTCPDCASRFKLDAELLGENGSKVRCASCENVWFQEPEFDEQGEFDVDIGAELDTEQDNFDLAKGLEDAANEDEPFIKDDAVQDFADYVDDLNLNVRVKPEVVHIQKNKSIGYGVGVASFFIIFIYLLVNSATFAKEYPSMHSIYSMLKIKTVLPGQGLVFDKIIAADNGGNISVSGHIVNLESDERFVPLIEATLLGAGDVVINRWHITPPKDSLNAEAMLSFDSIYYKQEGAAPHKPGEMNLHLRFVLYPNLMANYSGVKTKTDVADEGSNQVLGQSDFDHQSDHAESPKFDQPSSSDHHQEAAH